MNDKKSRGDRFFKRTNCSRKWCRDYSRSSTSFDRARRSGIGGQRTQPFVVENRGTPPLGRQPLHGRREAVAPRPTLRAMYQAGSVMEGRTGTALSTGGFSTFLEDRSRFFVRPRKSADCHPRFTERDGCANFPAVLRITEQSALHGNSELNKKKSGHARCRIAHPRIHCTTE